MQVVDVVLAVVQLGRDLILGKEGEELRISSYQWLLDNGCPKEKVFESYARALATTGSEEDQALGWRWLDSKGYPGAKASLYEIAKKMVEGGRYYEGSELFTELGDYKDSRKQANALVVNVTFRQSLKQVLCQAGTGVLIFNFYKVGSKTAILSEVKH